MTKMYILFLVFFSSNVFAQYFMGNNQLRFASGFQITEDGSVLFDKKKWDQKTHRKSGSVVYKSDKTLESNTWEEGPIKIKKHKNKIEVKYKDSKTEKKEIEYIFQGIREEKSDIASITNFDSGVIKNITTCFKKQCMTIDKKFCEDLSKNIGTQSKSDALEKAKQCLNLSHSLSVFKGNNQIITDLRSIHGKNMLDIQAKMSDYFNVNSEFPFDKQFELDHLIDLGDKNETYFEQLIEVLTSCQKNFP